MRSYLKLIKTLQQGFLGASIIIMVVLPLLIAFYPDSIMPASTLLYDIAHAAVFFVMIIRPLADLTFGATFVRPLVILRKGVGVFSAAIVISFTFAKIIVDPSGYLGSLGTASYWSLPNYALLGHLADLSAIILLVTSNSLSKRILGAWWKRIQRLSYVYFYASAFFVFLSYGNTAVVAYIAIVTTLTVVAALVNAYRRYTTSIETL
jgi:DMSO/TMAO reductase YedYZ heme-binding membrane subunit